MIIEDKDYIPEFMEMAVRLSYENIGNGGGPFGAVITRDGELIAKGVNTVTKSNDPTAHAEVSAVREACRRLGTFRLTDCVVYSSCEPCPMCLSALYWAGVKKIFYGNTKEDAAAIDFSDRFIYEEIERTPGSRRIPAIHVEGTGAIAAFERWASDPAVTKY